MATPPKLRALLCLENGRNTYSAGIETVETLPDINARPENHMLLSSVKEKLKDNAIWKSDDESKPYTLTPLPIIQPKRPNKMDEEDWNRRRIFGNGDFHVYLVRKEREQNSSIAPVVIIMKVSRDRNSADRCKYESMDFSSPKLIDEADSFLKKVKCFLKSNPGAFGDKEVEAMLMLKELMEQARLRTVG